MKTTKVGKAVEVKAQYDNSNVEVEIKHFTELLNMVETLKSTQLDIDKKILTYTKNLVLEQEAKVLTLLKGK